MYLYGNIFDWVNFNSTFSWLQTFFNIFQQDDGKGDGDGDGEKRFDGSGYDKDLVEALERDILQKNPNVHWYVIKKKKRIDACRIKVDWVPDIWNIVIKTL